MIHFTCERPYAFYLLILLVPALIISISQYRRIAKKLSFFSVKSDTNPGLKRVKNFRLLMTIRTILRSIAWIMLVLAFSGLSWGTYLEPVSRSGKSVSFVFDISYSMMASDAQGKTTRLEAASKYAMMLLSHMEDTTFSMVIAKGDGACVVPLTEDTAVAESLLASLSPSLMSSGGTSLGKGIRKALESFPEKSSRLSTIWVFTDGEETDSLLEPALCDALRKGVSVCIVGFGGEKEVSVLAGDGKTRIQTSLRSENMKNVCRSALSKTYPDGKIPVRAQFVDSREAGSALTVLSFLKGEKSSSGEDDGSFVTYEVRPVRRYAFFSFLSILFFALGFLVTELDVEGVYFRSKMVLTSSLLTVFLLSSCSSHFDGSMKILEGTWEWYKHKFNSATAIFYQTASDAESQGDKELFYYSVYNLGTTYIMQNEDVSGEYRLSQIPESAPDEVKFRAFYNMGLIAFERGDYDSAAEKFRSALKIDGSRMNAKVNLELSLQKKLKEAETKQNAVLQVSEDNSRDSMENSVFSRIRENDINRWKNSSREEGVSGAQDY